MARYQSAVSPYVISEHMEETSFTRSSHQRRMIGGMSPSYFNHHIPYGQIMGRPQEPYYNHQMPQQQITGRSDEQIMGRPQEPYYDHQMPQQQIPGRSDEPYSNSNMPRRQIMNTPEQSFKQQIAHDKTPERQEETPLYRNDTPNDQTMDRQSEPSFGRNMPEGQMSFGHPVILNGSNNAPQVQIIYRSPEPPAPPEKKRKPEWIILTRVCSAILIILDNVSDWMQYFEMTSPLDEIDFKSFKTAPKLNCTDISDITNKYMYFTIAGTVLSVIQIANICYQIYHEVQYLRGKKTGENEEENKKGTIQKARKLLDGRTETFYSTVFIEIPQTILLLKYQDGCLPGCNVDDFWSDEKQLKKRIMALINGFLGLLNNFWRYLTSDKSCEESVEDKKDGKCCKNGGCCAGCGRSLFKCCCPCCCCFHRYECSIPCFLWGKTCVCDACHLDCEPNPCEFPFGCCTLYYCPLKDDKNLRGGQDCIKVKRNCCQSSDEPLGFHQFLALLGNGIYFVLYVFNVLSMFCLFLNEIIIEPIFLFIINNVVTIF